MTMAAGRMTMGFAAIMLGGCSIGARDSVRVAATIEKIERTCNFIVKDPLERRPRYEEDSCDSTEEFAKMRDNAKSRRRDIQGNAVVTVSYTSPVDKSLQIAELKLNGRDDRFYTLHRGDTIDLYVDKKDPARVSLPDA